LEMEQPVEEKSREEGKKVKTLDWPKKKRDADTPTAPRGGHGRICKKQAGGASKKRAHTKRGWNCKKPLKGLRGPKGHRVANERNHKTSPCSRDRVRTQRNYYA